MWSNRIPLPDTARDEARTPLRFNHRPAARAQVRAAKLAAALLLSGACGGGVTDSHDSDGAVAQPTDGAVPTPIDDGGLASGDGGPARPDAASPSATQVVVNVKTAQKKPVPRGFLGYNTNDAPHAMHYQSPAFIDAVDGLDAGWLRFPGGNNSLAFAWETGAYPDAYIEQFSEGWRAKMENRRDIVRGKGYLLLTDFARLVQRIDGGLILCLNLHTGDIAGVRKLAHWIKDKEIDVDYWELGNEAYFWTRPPDQFFGGALAYARKAHQAADAIKEFFPAAKVAISVALTANALHIGYDEKLATYTPRFWDAVSVHRYDAQSANTFAEAMARGNAALNDIVSGGERAPEGLAKRARALFGDDTEILITEANLRFSGPGADTLYAAIFSAEHAMRAARHPLVKKYGYQVLARDGFNTIERRHDEVAEAGRADRVIDTRDWELGIFRPAGGLAMQMVGSAINQASQQYETIVRGGTKLPTPAVTLPDLEQPPGEIPAVFAQAYPLLGGRTRLLITNKSEDSFDLQVKFNGTTRSDHTSVQVLSDPDPKAKNTRERPERLQIEEAPAGRLRIPPYSVILIEYGRDGDPAAAAPTVEPDSCRFVCDNQAGVARYRIWSGTAPGRYRTMRIVRPADLPKRIQTKTMEGTAHYRIDRIQSDGSVRLGAPDSCQYPAREVGFDDASIAGRMWQRPATGAWSWSDAFGGTWFADQTDGEARSAYDGVVPHLDTDVSVRFRFAEDATSGAVGLYLRNDGGADREYRAYYSHESGSPQLVFENTALGTRRVVDLPAALDPQAEHFIRVHAQASTIRVFLDGTMHLAFIDPTIRRGATGLWVRNQRIYFDRYTRRGIPVRVHEANAP